MGTLRIPRAVTGYPMRAHGGYVAGSLARLLDGQAEAILRAPVPVDADLVVEASPERVTLGDGTSVLAEAVPGAVSVEPPKPVSVEEATEASRRYLGLSWHPYPWCYVCGPGKEEGEGLRVFAGPAGDGSGVAALWTPVLPDGLDPELVPWCALDCPGAWALWEMGDMPRHARLVTRRLAVRALAPVRAGEPHVIVAEPRAPRGRLYKVALAMYTGEGRPVAHGQATWFRP